MTVRERPPTETEQPGIGGATKEVLRTHPAFGQISAHRVSGHATLYGSPIKHNGFIAVTLVESEEHIDLHHEWRHPKKHLTEVWLSEAQWATFVSTLNVSSGVPCTIRYAPTGPLENKPLIIDSSWQVKNAKDIERKVREDMAALTAAVAALNKLAEQPSIRKSDFKEVLSNLNNVVRHAPGNWQFAADTATEHTEHLITAAKADLSAYVTRLSAQFPQIASAAPEVDQIEDQTKGEKK